MIKTIASLVVSYLSEHDWFCLSFESSAFDVVQTQTTILQVQKHQPPEKKNIESNRYQFAFTLLDNKTFPEYETIDVHCAELFAEPATKGVISCLTFDPKVIWSSTMLDARTDPRAMNLPRNNEACHSLTKQDTFFISSDIKQEYKTFRQLADGTTLHGCSSTANVYMSESKKYLVSAHSVSLNVYCRLGSQQQQQHLTPVLSLYTDAKKQRPLKWQNCAFSYDDTLMMIREDKSLDGPLDDDNSVQLIVPTTLQSQSAAATITKFSVHELKEGQQVPLPLACIVSRNRRMVFSPSERRMFSFLHDILHVFSFENPTILRCEKVFCFDNLSLVNRIQAFESVSPVFQSAITSSSLLGVANTVLLANWTYTGQCIHVQTIHVEHLEIDVTNGFSVTPVDYNDQKTEFSVQHTHSLRSVVDFARLLSAQHRYVVTNGPFAVTVDPDVGAVCVRLFDWIHRRLVKTVQYRPVRASFAFQSAEWGASNLSRLFLFFYSEEEKRASLAVLTSPFLCIHVPPTYKTDLF